MGKIIVGQEDLGCFEVMGLKEALIGSDEPHLADGGRGLKFMQGTGAARPAEAAHAFCDGAG